MKKISGRTVFTTFLAVVVVIGLMLFTVEYFVKADDWVTAPGSPHVYNGINISTGSVRDREGVTLLNNTSGAREYADDTLIRKATLHLLGDRYEEKKAALSLIGHENHSQSKHRC